VATAQNAKHKLDELQQGYRPEEIAAAEARYQQTVATLDKLQRGNRREGTSMLQKAALSYGRSAFSANARLLRHPPPPWKSLTSVLAIWSRPKHTYRYPCWKRTRSISVFTFRKRKSDT